MKGWRSAHRWHALLAAFVLASVSSPVLSQGTWRPEKNVELVVPAAAGGATDATARLIQRILQNQRLIDVPVLTVNKTGGGGNIALVYLDQRPGDPHLLLNSTMSLMTNHILGLSKVTYTDYTPVAVLYGEYMVFVVRPDSPLKSARDVMERLRKDPQSLSMAIGVSLAGTNNLALSLVTRAMGVDTKKLKTVVFQANAQTVTALMGGHVDLAPMSVGTALNAAQQGRLRIIGITADRRGDGPLAQIPTFREQGYDVVFTNTRFMIGPKGMSPASLAYWDGTLERVVQSDEWKTEVEKNHWAFDHLGSRQTGQRLADMYRQLKGALADAGMSKEP
jgi:putative tricarboxylic transport membrane protein